MCDRRTKVVLLRGKVPCDVLFIGEAPGGSEDILGKPFCGPVGITFDEIIDAALDMADVSDYLKDNIRLAFTNIIACIPRDEEYNKITEPPDYAIKACADRLEECIRMCNPGQIVYVGKHAAKWVPKLQGYEVLPDPGNIHEIIHPGAIVKAGAQSQQLMAQKVAVELSTVFEQVIPF